MMKSMNNPRFEAAERKLEEMILSKFGNPEKEMFRIAHKSKDEEKAKRRMAEVMELWRFDPDVYRQLEFDDEV